MRSHKKEHRKASNDAFFIKDIQFVEWNTIFITYNCEENFLNSLRHIFSLVERQPDNVRVFLEYVGYGFEKWGNGVMYREDNADEEFARSSRTLMTSSITNSRPGRRGRADFDSHEIRGGLGLAAGKDGGRPPVCADADQARLPNG
jgi:hypothetical protein